jgi:hypothetical protein
MFAFFKRKIEDEMVSKIRLESLVGLLYVNYLILLPVWFFIGFSFLSCNEVQYSYTIIVLYYPIDAL